MLSPILIIGTRHKPESYQSVNLNSLVVKILEKIIEKELFMYLDENQTLFKEEHDLKRITHVSQTC